MKLTETKIIGAYIIEQDVYRDERGSFTRLYDKRAFAEHGLAMLDDQLNLSETFKKGTLRGLHYQTAPSAQAKLMRCVHGKIFNAIVDMRKDSPTRKTWVGVELSRENGKMLYVPEGCANGFLVLEDDTIVFYPLSAPHDPSTERGVRFDDPSVGIAWPEQPTIVSDKDRSWPDVA